MAQKYWVGSTGALDGSTTTHISDTSGGAGGAVYPSGSDILNFDSNSGGGTVTITATCNIGSLYHLSGTTALDFGSATVNSTIAISGTSVRTVNLNSSTINAPIWNAQVTTNLTFNAGTSTINVTGTGNNWYGGGLTYNTVTFSGLSQTYLNGTATFATLTVTGPATKTGFLALVGNQTVTGTLTINGNSSTNRILVLTNVRGTQYTITAATVTVTNADFQDIVGAGAGSWNLSAITGGSGDCGGNSGITFTTAATQYWYTTTTGSKTWSTAGNWFLGSGGTGGAGRVPLPQDTARFDASSIGAASTTITQDMPRIGRVDFTGVTNSPTWTTSTAASFFGSITLVSGMALGSGGTPQYTYEGRGSSTLISAGQSWIRTFDFNAPGGTLSFGDAFSTTQSMVFTSGTVSTDFNVTANTVTYNTGTKTITMGSGTWTITSTGTSLWTMDPAATLNSGTSTIRLTGALTGASTFSGAGKTYYRLENATTGAFALQFTGSNTFTDGIYVDASAAARTVQFTAGTTTTVGRIGRLDATTNVITIDSITAANHALAKSGGGVISGLDYLTVGHSDASPALTWYAGANSTNGGTNTGWIFTAAPGGGGSLLLLGVG